MKNGKEEHYALRLLQSTDIFGPLSYRLQFNFLHCYNSTFHTHTYYIVICINITYSNLLWMITTMEFTLIGLTLASQVVVVKWNVNRSVNGPSSY